VTAAARPGTLASPRHLVCERWRLAWLLGAAAALLGAATATAYALSHRALGVGLGAAALLCLAAFLLVVSLRHAQRRRPQAAADAGGMELVAVGADAAGEAGADERRGADGGPAVLEAEAGTRGPVASAFLGLAFVQVAPRPPACRRAW
jgi:hypothetical protein